MPTLMPTDTAAALGPTGKDCESRSLLLDRFVFANPDMNEARKLHFAQVCADSFGTIRTTRESWQKTATDEKARSFLKDTEGLGARKSAAGGHSVKALAHAALAASAANDSLLYAQLQSRLVVNMAGGVMENAGLCLDRFGLPYIPGSAGKGCARRAALAALHEWCETSQKPGAAEQDKDNLFKEACAPFNSPADMLAAIARVFGWCEQDWKTREEVLKSVSPRRNEDDAQFQRRCQKLWEEKRSDFAWACEATPSDTAASPAPTGRTMPAQGNALGTGPQSNASPEGAEQVNATGWTAIRDSVVRRLAAGLSITIKSDDPAPWRRLPNFAGSVSFLPAYPVDLPSHTPGLPLLPPPFGKLELDVVTVHHKQYYAEPAEPKDVSPTHLKWQEWKRKHDVWQAQWGTAPDIEEPVPNVFPAVAPGHVFGFALAPLRGADAKLVEHARTWLTAGLSTFGLGAKTNAGYGWFDCSKDVQQTLRQKAERERAERERQTEEQRRIAEEEERRRKAEAVKAATKDMTTEQKADYELAQLTPDQLRGRLDQLLKREKPEREAMVRALRLPPEAPNSRRRFWDDLKQKAQKGGKPAQIEQAIRQLSRQMFPGKEGRMP